MVVANATTVGAALDLLCILGFVDGRLVESEITVLKKYMLDTYGTIENIDEEIERIRGMSFEEMQERLHTAAVTIKRNLSPGERAKLLNFVLDVIFADGVLHNNEKISFNALSKLWEIEAPKL